MKKLILTLAIAALGIVVAQAQTTPATPATPITPATPTHPSLTDKSAPHFQFVGGETHDFGTVIEGPDAEYTFKFKNTGKTPLVINNASASCSCTVPTWSKEPIAPGKTGELKVVFHTAGKGGQPFTKTVYISSNAASDKDRYEVNIKGTVAPSAPATPATPATPAHG